MSEGEPTTKRHPLLLVILITLLAVAGWHFFCHLRLETKLQRRANNYLVDALPGATATVDIQPITNLVSIQVQRPVRPNEVHADTIGDAMVGLVSAGLEPRIERDLETVARSSLDLYAVMLPYHVSIEVEKVRAGYSKLVEDIQSELIRLGYKIGQADGVIGAKTKKAIADVQAQLRQAQDGEPSQELLDALTRARSATDKSMWRTNEQ